MSVKTSFPNFLTFGVKHFDDVLPLFDQFLDGAIHKKRRPAGGQRRFHPGRPPVHLAGMRAFAPQAIEAPGHPAQGFMRAVGVEPGQAQIFEQGCFRRAERRRRKVGRGQVRQRIGFAPDRKQVRGQIVVRTECIIADGPAAGGVRQQIGVVQIVPFRAFGRRGVEDGRAPDPAAQRAEEAVGATAVDAGLDHRRPETARTRGW